MEIKLITENSVTEEQEQQVFTLPIVMGRENSQLPNSLEGQQTSPIVLFDSTSEISRFHAVIKELNGQIILEDLSSNGTRINGQKLVKESRPLKDGDIIQVGNYSITVSLVSSQTVISNPEGESIAFNSDTNIAPASAKRRDVKSSTIIFNPETDLLEFQSSEAVTPRSQFPPSEIFGREQVSMDALQSTNLPIEQKDFVSLGGGMGSFVWCDYIRIGGISSENIAVIGLNPIPYARYERLLTNCQIFRYKRIRSGSDSCPDNIWGWPGYAIRESWRDLFAGKINGVIEHLWQVFAEPVLADTYTPRAGDVFVSMDREAKRIGWEKMFRQGSIRSIRKTTDGRYCIAYSDTQPGRQDHRFLIAKYVHLCTGYPALKLLPDLLEYRETTEDLKSIVQGYEPHEHIYEQVEKKGGTVIIRGSGIVASQVMDRLYLAHKVNPAIKVIHLNREPRRGNKFRLTQREVENDWEFQPFNWPKGTWGGTQRKILEEATPQQRRELLQDWGGTTTASRKHWRRMVSEGLKDGWYEIRYGLVKEVLKDSKRGVNTKLVTNKGETLINADFIIDCTGLISNPRENPLLDDLITHYNLDLNPQGRLHVKNHFEIEKMRNNQGRMYASGIITLGGPYAPVDTFLGLQYAAHRITENLASLRESRVKYITGIYSLIQWLKWANNQSPSR